MKQKSGSGKAPAEQVLKDIRRQTRRQYSAEEKIRIVLEGLRGEENISELCCRSVQISASSVAHDRNRSTTIHPMSLQTSFIPRQHRPILDQLPARLGLR